MNQNAPDLLNLKDEIIKYKNELNYLLEISKQNEKLIEEGINYNPFKEDINSIKNEINSLNKEINSLKEINNKTIDFLLLKIESNLDIQKQLIQNQDVYASNYIDNDERNDNVSYDKIKKYERIINSKNIEINSLNEKLLKLTNELNTQNELIDNIISQKEISGDFMDVIDLWNAKFNFLKRESEEKEDNINSLKEEIIILKSIIKEKDNTINSLK